MIGHRVQFLRGALILLLGGTFLFAQPAPKPAAVSGPLSPRDALKEFRVAPGLRVELVAAEPEIESPVAMAFDEDGKLWVVEMRDYPNGPPKGQPPEGRIRVLEDRDGDGRYETSTVFADHLLFANGLLPWKGGVLVTAAPHIVYLRDTDGDGKADKREVLYEGFAAENPQLRVSHPTLGLDGWVYVANGLRGGQVVRSGRAGVKPITLGSMDFRFDLIHDRAEAISGMGQYGNTFDDWGRRFVCDNRHHLRHIVLPNRYLQRNPFLAVPAVVEDTSELELGEAGAGAKIYPLSKNWTTSNLHAGRFTAACGVFIYRGALLPEEYRGAAFTCDPTGDLIHEEILTPRGATFRSRPPRDKSEFLATPDDWCRPVFVTSGPDGAMYVVDMYRAVIEHPEFMPAELKQRPDLLLGKDKGRIWRIVPEKHQTKPLRPALGKASTAELVKLLEHADAWWRTTAQRLLLERQDRSAVELLRKLCASSEKPLARLHAAWLLENFGSVDEEIVLRLLGDKEPRVREQALVLGEPWLGKSAPVQERVLALAYDADAAVRFQAALTLGEWDEDRILPALAKIALAGADDPWTRAAVASAVPKRAGKLIVTLFHPMHGLSTSTEGRQAGSTEGRQAGRDTPGRVALLQELAALVGARRDGEEVAALLAGLTALGGKDAQRWQMAGLLGLTDGMARRGTQLGTFLEGLPEGQRKSTRAVEALLGQAAKVGADDKRSTGERLEAIRLLAHAPREVARPVLLRLLKDDAIPGVRLGALRSLAAQPGSDVPKLLLESWSSYTPGLRQEAVNAMLMQPDRVLFLLGELEAGRIPARELDAASARRLLTYGRADVRARAEKVLQAGTPDERKQVLKRYQEALTLKGDAQKGREVFRQNCAACHRIAGIGTVTGPDISDTRTKTAEQLLLDILDPNAAIDANYINYQVTTKNGKLFTGLIAAETASSVTLRRGEDQTDVILRQDIEELRSTGLSLMPEGLEKNISIAQMADLLSFLKNWRYLDGAVPLGKP
jgi:putative membrane-bound dehydrogenase-like protein